MTPPDRTRTEQARSIFEEASEHTPGERESFLAEACGGDDALRAEVESLLRAADRAGAFLSAPQAPARPATDGAVGLPPLVAHTVYVRDLVQTLVKHGLERSRMGWVIDGYRAISPRFRRVDLPAELGRGDG